MRDDDNGVSRRRFLETSLACGALGATGLGFRLPGSETPAAPSTAQVPSFALEELSIDDLQARMRDGRDTAQSLAQQYLARIDAIDQRGPAINSVIELNPDALSIAAQLDGERKAGRLRGPMHGIPVLIKDNIDTADRMHTTAGSLALAENLAARDSFVAERLRAAGAVIIGK